MGFFRMFFGKGKKNRSRSTSSEVEESTERHDRDLPDAPRTLREIEPVGLWCDEGSLSRIQEAYAALIPEQLRGEAPPSYNI